MKIKESFFRLSDESSKEYRMLFGFLFALLALIIILLSLFWGGTIGGVDYGEYDATLSAVGLKRTAVDLADSANRYYTSVNDTFDFDKFSYNLLLSPGETSLVYPVTIVRLLSMVSGSQFHTETLAVIYALLLSFSMFLLAITLYRRYGGFAGVPCSLGLLILCVSRLTGYMNSLHWLGTAFVGLYGFVCVFVWAAFSPLRGRLTRFVVLCIFGLLLCGAHSTMMVFLPVTILAELWILLRDRPHAARAVIYFVVGASILLWSAQRSFSAETALSDYTSAFSHYQATFSGSIQSSENPSAALAYYGLDDSYLSDVGLSYYQAGSDFKHDPKQASEWSQLENKLTLKTTLCYYLENPKVMVSLLKNKTSSLHSLKTGRVAVKGSGNSQQFINIFSLIGFLLPLIGQLGFMILAGILMIVAVLFLILGKSKSRFFPLSFVLLALLSGAAYLPWTAVIGGSSMIDIAKPIFGAESLILIAGVCTFVLRGVTYALANDNKEDTVVLQPVIQKPSLIINGATYLAGNAKRTVIAASVLSLCMLYVLLFVPPHAGGVNNGDFGRMMNELGIKWTSELDANTADQAGKNVIEEYDYSTAFDPLKLTAAEPTYSLIFPASLVRLYSSVTGSPFNTRIIQYIYCLITVLCILSIIYDLYPIWGIYTMIMAVFLPLMLLGENYIAWYNSLFGESSISIGLIMTLAACVHLAVHRHGKWQFLWLLLLAFSLNVLVCAKAQMLLALPAGIGLIMFFFIYQHRMVNKVPLKILYFIMMAALIANISIAGIGVYRDNNAISSKQTIWQSVFYGALMISDDVDASMKELNIPPEMKADIGKNAYLPDSDYVYAPTSQKAQELFYDHINTFTMVKYYLHHPKDLLYMLNYAASQAINLHTGFMLYKGQRYDLTHDTISRFSLWSIVRSYLAPRAFWQYVLLYGMMLLTMMCLLMRKSVTRPQKALTVTWLALLVIGVLQYPLTVIGNGFADNNKQLYTFMLCHDLLILTLATFLISAASELIRKKTSQSEILSMVGETESEQRPQMQNCTEDKVET